MLLLGSHGLGPTISGRNIVLDLKDPWFCLLQMLHSILQKSGNYYILPLTSANALIWLKPCIFAVHSEALEIIAKTFTRERTAKDSAATFSNAI